MKPFASPSGECPLEYSGGLASETSEDSYSFAARPPKNKLRRVTSNVLVLFPVRKQSKRLRRSLHRAEHSFQLFQIVLSLDWRELESYTIVNGMY